MLAVARVSCLTDGLNMWRLNMLRVLTKEESLASAKEKFKELNRQGQLFNLAMRRYFILVERLGDTAKVIELNQENIQRILHGESCVTAMLHVKEMRGLNVHRAD